jgi:hypothetical protein
MESEQERPDEQSPAQVEAPNDDAAALGEALLDEAAGPVADDAPPAVADAQIDTLAGSLLWRIGRAYEDGPVTVRVGLASAAPLFADLPRLRAASEQEVEAAIHDGDVQVEWVGPRLGGRA